MSPVWQVELSEEFTRQAEDITAQLRAELVSAAATTDPNAAAAAYSRYKSFSRFTLAIEKLIDKKTAAAASRALRRLPGTRGPQVPACLLIVGTWSALFAIDEANRTCKAICIGQVTFLERLGSIVWKKLDDT